jgi:hypothetical protein
MSGLARVEAIADHLLAEHPEPVLQVRLLRDVLRRHCGDSEAPNSWQVLNQSRGVRHLVNAQRPDGSWGRFHSADVSARQTVPTTEFGVERGLALGLDASHAILAKAATYISGILQGTTSFPDPPERNPRWSLGVQLFASATLARINPTLSVLNSQNELWRSIALEAFATDEYDAVAEAGAHRARTGLIGDLRYLTLDSKYHAALLGARASLLPPRVQRAYLRWLWQKPDGLGYKRVALHPPPAHAQASAFELWLSSLELLTPFAGWHDFAKPAVDWLWTQRTDNGCWDFGPRSPSSAFFPLADNWRLRRARQVDWTTRILLLLREYYEQRKA